MNGECYVVNASQFNLVFLYKSLGFEYYQHRMFKCIFLHGWTWAALVCHGAKSSHIACKMPVNINVSSWHLPAHASQTVLDLLLNPNSLWWNHNATTRWQHLCNPLSPVHHTQVFFSTSVISQIQCKSVKPFHWLKCCLLYLGSTVKGLPGLPLIHHRSVGCRIGQPYEQGGWMLDPEERQMLAASVAPQKSV